MEGLLLLLALLLLVLLLVLLVLVLLLPLLGEGRMRKWETRGIWVFCCPRGRALGQPVCVYALLHTTIIKSVCKKLATRGGLRAFAVSPFGAIWRHRVLCDALPGIAVSPCK